MILKLLMLGVLQATSYRALPSQTKSDCTSRWHCTTATGDNVSELGVAVSQDFIKSGQVKYGDTLFIEGVGYRIVNDCMNKRHKRAIDVFVYTQAEEHAFGTRHLRVYLVSKATVAHIATSNSLPPFKN